ncbi:MAG: hypothetical protein ABL932_11205 [Terricaulis sp.]
MLRDSRIALYAFVAGVFFVGQSVVLSRTLWSGVIDGSELSAGMFVLWLLSGLVMWPGVILTIISAAVFIASLFAKSRTQAHR